MRRNQPSPNVAAPPSSRPAAFAGGLTGIAQPESFLRNVAASMHSAFAWPCSCRRPCFLSIAVSTA
ncbi:MAG: hypothetical protein M5U09_13485 [Gammaproteobacteria bacterium]|nr:hypothetical protein [Gammaproteobacteria bacterium]